MKATLAFLLLLPISLFGLRYLVEPTEKLAEREIILVATLISLESKESHTATPNEGGDPKFKQRLDGRYLKERNIEGSGILHVSEILKGSVKLEEKNRIGFTWSDKIVIEPQVLRFDRYVGYPAIWYLELDENGRLDADFGSAQTYNRQTELDEAITNLKKIIQNQSR